MNFNTEDFVRPLATSIFHGASPTSFYCGSSLFHLMDLKRKEQIESTKKLQVSDQTPQIMEKSEMETEEIDFEDHPSGYTKLHVTSCQGEKTLVEQIVENTMDLSEINQQDRNGNTPLIWASSEGHYEVVQILVENGASLNVQNFKGETALFLAASRGLVNICRYLLENGADPNLGNMESVTPGHIAAVHGHTEILACLNHFGAFMNAQDEEGDTILHYAVRESQEKVVEYLVLHARVCLNIPNDDQETPLELATCIGESRMVEFLFLNQEKESEHEGTFAMTL